MEPSHYLDQLLAYIKQELSKGHSEESIRQMLLQHNWHPDWVNHAFATLHQPPQPAQTPMPVAAQSQQAPRQKYRVFRAVSDALVAIKANWLMFVIANVAAYVLCAVSLFLLGMVIGLLLGGDVHAVTASGFRLIMAIVLIYVLASLWYVLAYALIITAPALAVVDGRAGRRSNFVDLARRTGEILPRVIRANFLLALVFFGPLYVLLLLPIVMIVGHTGNGAGGAFLSVMCLLGAFVWMFIAALRYSLAPLVAVFEPHVPIRKTLKRSQHLLIKGGQWFIVKVALLLIVLAILLGVTKASISTDLRDSFTIVTNLAMLLVGSLLDAAFVMLYWNRRAVRGE